MSGKYLIFGATGSIGSNLSKMMAQNNEDVQLIGRHEESLKNISSETGFKYSVVDVLDNAKIENLKNEFANDEIKGIESKRSSFFWLNFDKIPNWNFVYILGTPKNTEGCTSERFFTNESIDSVKDITPPCLNVVNSIAILSAIWFIGR